MDDKKVLLITYHFPPCSSIGMHRSLRFARRLGEFGWRPVVLTARQEDLLHEPIDAKWQQLIPNTVPVYRARVLRPLQSALKLRGFWRRCRARWRPIRPQQPTGSQQSNLEATEPSWVQRWIDPWFTTPDVQIGWLPFAVWRGLRVSRAERVDCLYSSGPPYTAHLIALILKGCTKRPWVADFRDPWSRRPWDTDTHRRGLRYRIQVRLENVVVQHADRVISNTAQMAQDFRQHYASQPTEKFVVITNGYDPEYFQGVAQGGVPPDDVFTMTHAGALYGRRNPRPLLQAIAQLRDKGEVPPKTLQLRLVGSVTSFSEVELLVESLDLQEWVSIIPPVSHLDSLTYLVRSHLLLILQPDAPLQVPGKLFEYIYLQRPILALAGEGATAELLRQYRLGEVVDARDVEAIAAAIMRFYRDFCRARWSMHRAASALQDFHGRKLTERLAAIFNLVVTNS